MYLFVLVRCITIYMGTIYFSYSIVKFILSVEIHLVAEHVT